jgi:PAS domain S-box-containing protein
MQLLDLFLEEARLASIWHARIEADSGFVPVGFRQADKDASSAPAPLVLPELDALRRASREVLAGDPSVHAFVGSHPLDRPEWLFLSLGATLTGPAYVLQRPPGQGFGHDDRTFLCRMVRHAGRVLAGLREDLRILSVDEANRLRELEDIVARSPAIVLLWRNLPGWPVEYCSENIRQFGYRPSDLTSGAILWSDLIHPDDLPRVQDLAARHMLPHKDYQQRYRLRTRDGRYRHVVDLSRVRRDEARNVSHFEGLILDVTPQQEAESQIRQASATQETLNALLRLSLDDVPTGEILGKSLTMLLTSIQDVSLAARGAIFLASPESGRMERKASCSLSARDGRSREELGSEDCPSGCLGQERPDGCERGTAHRPRRIRVDEHGSREIWCVPVVARGLGVGRIVMELPTGQIFKPWEFNLMQAVAGLLAVIVERRRADEAVHRSEERFRLLFEQSPVGIGVLRADRVVEANTAFREMFACRENEEGLNLALDLLFPPAALALLKERAELASLSDSVRTPILIEGRGGGGRVFPADVRVHHANFVEGPAQVVHCMDLSEVYAARDRISRQGWLLDAIARIDHAITGRQELGQTLDFLLSQILEQLEVDAADFLLVSPDEQKLVCRARRGFRTRALQHAQFFVGEGLAGRAAQGGALVHVPDLASEPGELRRSKFIERERFVSYWGVPLLARGKLQGVLEVFRRSGGPLPEEWSDSLQLLAAQAAVAIEIALLTDDLRQTVATLHAAYEETIEGWARALELRDRETEGHTRRVTDLTQRTAQALGVKAQEIPQFRRGAILHDIGKMGVPDGILLKPGPLEPEEWAIMRLHPEFARSLLQPISHLREAMDIPYGHHERWDGSGYPLGLKGRAIPKSARIFAVVDVWDALRHARPYKRAWSWEEAATEIRSKAGVHFDPEIVDAFLGLPGLA